MGEAGIAGQFFNAQQLGRDLPSVAALLITYAASEVIATNCSIIIIINTVIIYF
jgi:hypothetical protein